MTSSEILFFLIGGLSVVFSLLVVFQRNVIYSAMALVATLFLVAVLFFTLDAVMVGVLQILVYAGAIMVLFLFVIMLLSPTAVEGRRVFWWGLGSLAALLLLLQFMPLLSEGSAVVSNPGVDGAAFGSPELLAQSLFRDFVLPFEIASIVLLVAIIGAVVLAKREP